MRQVRYVDRGVSLDEVEPSSISLDGIVIRLVCLRPGGRPDHRADLRADTACHCHAAARTNANANTNACADPYSDGDPHTGSYRHSDTHAYAGSTTGTDH